MRFQHLLSFRNFMTLLMLLAFINLVGYLLLSKPLSKKKPSHEKIFLERQTDENKLLQPVTRILADEGYGVWIQNRSIQVMIAIKDLHHPNNSESRIVLPSFLRHSSSRQFVCCFHKSLQAEAEDFHEVKGELDYIDLRFLVDFQNAVFACVVKHLPGSHTKYKYVSFAPETCHQHVSPSVAIVYPEFRSWELAVCTKLAYAWLDPVHLVEWFEFMKIVGVSKVLTFHNNLHPESLKVLNYYVKTGYLELISYTPRSSKGVVKVSYTDENAQTRQARQDKTLLVRDCQYRLGGYDYVMTVDFDELPVPVRPYGTINWILMESLLNSTDAGGFRMDPILMPPEWGQSKSGLYHWRFTVGTYIPPYCRKWVYLPKRTWLASTHENVPKKGFKTYVLSSSLLHFLHFRNCKSIWHDIPCTNLTQTLTNENVLDRFGNAMYASLAKLPLRDLIPNTQYVESIRRYMKNSVGEGTEDNAMEISTE